MGDLDQLKCRLMHRRLELLVPVPVAVGFFDNDVPLQQQTLQYLLDVERLKLCVPHSQGDILEVAEQCHVLRLGLAVH
jgi:hypothetical protein